MEKYFIVSEKSPLHKDFFEYRSNKAAVNDLIKKFFAEQGIKANKYSAANDALFIVPTVGDAEKFGTVLCASNSNGLRKFKASSKIHKAWVNALKENGLKVIGRPMVLLYFRTDGGRFRSRLFDSNGTLYCSMDPVVGETPEGMIEIKASEFFKVIEEAG